MKLKKIITILCLLSVVSLVSYAELKLQKIEKVMVGFSDPVAGVKSESIPLAHIGYAGALGFPVNNRELGFELPSVMTINQLSLELKLTKDVSQMSKFGIDKDIKLYASKDNKKYYLVTAYKLELKPFKLNNENRVKIEISDFSESAKYFKLCPRKGIKGYSGLIPAGKLQKAFTIYEKTLLAKLSNPRFMTDRFVILFELNVEDYKKTPLAKIELKAKDKWQLITKKKLNANGKIVLKINETLPKKLPVGKYLYRISVVDHKQKIVNSLISSFYHVKGIVNKAPGAGEIEILSPNSLKHTGKWTTETALSEFGETVKYVKANDPTSSCSVALPDSQTYAVYLGLVGGNSVAKVETSGKNQTLRLKTWRRKILNDNTAGEVFFGFFKGGKLKVSAIGAPIKLSHIRVQGLTEKQQNLMNSQAVIVPRLIFHNDGFSGFYMGKMKDRDELVKLAEEYKNKPLYSYDWCLGTSTAFNIKTRRGVLFGEGKTKFWRRGDKRASQIVNNLYKQGINPLQVIAQNLNKEKIHVNATLRLNATYPPRVAASHNGPLLMDNPQFRIVNAQGKRLWKLSYAHPEVREFMLSVLEDALNSGIDGIHLQFMRHPSFFGVDKPLIAEYKKRYGSFELKKDYMNRKWQELQCEAMTNFVKSIRQIIDRRSSESGKKLTLSASFDFKNYYKQGLDIAAWVKSGWIDVISPGYYGAGGKTFELAPFVKMTSGTSCKIFPHLEMTLQGTDPTPESESGKVKILRESVSPDYGRKLFLEFYNQGAYGLYPFNGGTHLINAVANLKELKLWEEFEEPVIDWFYTIK